MSSAELAQRMVEKSQNAGNRYACRAGNSVEIVMEFLLKREIHEQQTVSFREDFFSERD